MAGEKNTRRSRVTLLSLLLSAHLSTPALYSPEELLCVFITPTCGCYLHMFSARQYLLHQELKQDRRDLASSSENKASSIYSASKRSKHVFWRDYFEFPLFTEPKWKEKDQINKKNETGSPTTLMSPKTCIPQSSQQASHFNSASLRVVSQPMTCQKRNGRYHNFIFLTFCF